MVAFFDADADADADADRNPNPDSKVSLHVKTLISVLACVWQQGFSNDII